MVCQKAAIGGITHPRCKSRYSIDGVFSSLAYRGVVKKLVYRFKYKPFLTDLETTLSDFLYEGIIQKENCYAVLQQELVFIPVPLHASRMRKRGYNQAELLANGLTKMFNHSLLKALERIKNTPTQVGLAQSAREANIKNAFRISKCCSSELSRFQTVCLVDDIVTSGATLKEAAKILKKAGVKNVWGITLAHGV